MQKPISLYIPEYFDKVDFGKKQMVAKKTKKIIPKDSNNSTFYASIEQIENYQCSLIEIGQRYCEIATRCFHRDREEGWEMSVKVDNCKVYHYNWDDEAFHFKIYWFVISEKYMLQLCCIFEPKNASFYKWNAIQNFQQTKIDTSFDYSQEHKTAHLFSIEKTVYIKEELQELMDAQQQKEDKEKYLTEHLKLSNPKFYKILLQELQDKEEATIESFMCKDWNMYYNLYNPENFSNPDSTIEWEENSDCFEYYEKPFTKPEKTDISCSSGKAIIAPIQQLVEKKKTLEKNLLTFFENYTFKNLGAYADGIHYKWAKIEIERLHNCTYTNQEFLKRNLCLERIELTAEKHNITLHFNCSWDTEHGIDILVKNGTKCSIEY